MLQRVREYSKKILAFLEFLWYSQCTVEEGQGETRERESNMMDYNSWFKGVNFALRSKANCCVNELQDFYRDYPSDFQNGLTPDESAKKALSAWQVVVS